MAITYTFKVTELEVAPSLDGQSDVVTRVRYNYAGVDDNGVSGSFQGATPMPAPSGSFIPYNELTQETVVTWLDEVSDKPHMQEQITKQINNQINPKYVPTPIPWPTGSL